MLLITQRLFNIAIQKPYLHLFILLFCVIVQPQAAYSATRIPDAAAQEPISAELAPQTTTLSMEFSEAALQPGEQHIVWGKVVQFVAKTIAGWLIEGTLDYFFKDDFDRFLDRTRRWLGQEFEIADQNNASGGDQVKAELIRLGNLMTTLENRVKNTEQSQQELMAFVQNMYTNELLPMQERLANIEVRLDKVERELNALEAEISSIGLQVQENSQRIADVENVVYTNVRVVPEGGIHAEFTQFKTSYLQDIFDFVPFRVDSVQVLTGLGVSLGFRVNELFILTARGSLFFPQEKELAYTEANGRISRDSLNVLNYEGFSLALGGVLNLSSDTGFGATIGGGYAYHKFSVGYGTKLFGQDGFGSITDEENVGVNLPYVTAGIRVQSEGFILWAQLDALMPEFNYQGIHFVVGASLALSRNKNS